MAQDELGAALAMVGGIMLIFAIVTAPIWLAAFLGRSARRCKCGARIRPGQIDPYCICDYY